MIKINPYLGLLIIATLAFASCKKKDKVSNCDLTEANLVGSYKLVSIKYKPSPASAEIDGTFLLDPCELDDITTFSANHTFAYVDAGTQCSTPGDYSGTWSLNGSTLDFDGRSPTIVAFDCTGFTTTDTSYNTDGDKLTLTLRKQ